MKVVIDTSPIWWLSEADYLEVIPKVYGKIWAPPGVPQQIKRHERQIDYAAIERFLINVDTNLEESENERFWRLIRRWSRKLGFDRSTEVDVQVFVLYKFFRQADEMLFANKEAEARIGPYGKVRDIYQIGRLAEKERVWTPKESKQYLHTLLDMDYQTPLVKKELERYRKVT